MNRTPIHTSRKAVGLLVRRPDSLCEALGTASAGDRSGVRAGLHGMPALDGVIGLSTSLDLRVHPGEGGNATVSLALGGETVLPGSNVLSEPAICVQLATKRSEQHCCAQVHVYFTDFQP